LTPHTGQEAHVVVAAPVLLFALATSLTAAAPTKDADTDTAEIFQLLIDDRLDERGEAPDGDYMVLAAETLVVCLPDVTEKEGDFSIGRMIDRSVALTDVSESMRRELLCRDQVEYVPSSSFARARVVLASEITAIFTGGGWWEAFYQTFPGSRGYMQFTSPAFSTGRDQALVYVSHACGGLCGTGWIVRLGKGADGRWRITSREMLWIS
jgi:hypothetical protein